MTEATTMSVRVWQPGSLRAVILDDGRIKREDVPEPYNQPSGQWLCTGAVRFNNFGYIVERFTLDDVLHWPQRGLRWHHKNGKQRIILTDFDHGTRRTWGNTLTYVHPPLPGDDK